MQFLRLVFALGLAAMPSFIKNPFYRWFYGYRIGKGVRIGWTVFLGVRRCTIGDHARIGSFNLFYQIADLEIGPHVQIGFLNLFRGGEQVIVGAYATILRLNVFNAILEADFVEPVEPRLELGTGVFVATGHWFDFSNGIRVGDHSIVGGRNSSFWTHNRQRGKPITIGCHTYLGSEVRAAPGVVVPSFCIVAIGSVLIGEVKEPRTLIASNPAHVLRELTEDDLLLVVRKTRKDIPDDVARALLPEDLRRLLDGQNAREPTASC